MFILLHIPPKINTSILWCPRFSPSPIAHSAPAPTAIPQLFDEGECHNTLGVNQTQRQAEQTIQRVCACLCKIQSLRVSPAFGCQQLSGDAESVRASAQGGRPAPFGPAIPTCGFELSPAQAAAKKLTLANQFPVRPARLPRPQPESGHGFPSRPCPVTAPFPCQRGLARPRAAGSACWQRGRPDAWAKVGPGPQGQSKCWAGAARPATHIARLLPGYVAQARPRPSGQASAPPRPALAGPRPSGRASAPPRPAHGWGAGAGCRPAPRAQLPSGFLGQVRIFKQLYVQRPQWREENYLRTGLACLINA